GSFYDGDAKTAVTGTNIDDLAGGSSIGAGIDTSTLANLGAGVEITLDVDVDSAGSATTVTVTMPPGANTIEDVAAAIEQQLQADGFDNLSVRTENDDFVITNNATDSTVYDITAFSITEQGDAAAAPALVEAGTTIASR